MADKFSSEGEVRLLGFHAIDEPVMGDVKLIVGKKLRRFSELCKSFEQVVLHLKKVHAQPHSEKYEIHASLKDKGKLYTTIITHKDLLLAVEAAMKKLESEASKARTL